MDFIKVDMPAGIGSLGKWYQPYLHSGKRSFRESQQQHYSDFNLTSEIKKAETLAKQIFADLKKFYAGREEKLAKLLGIKKEDMSATEFADKLLRNMASDLEGGSTNFPGMREAYETIKKTDNKKMKEYVDAVAESHVNSFEAGWNKFLSQATKTPTKAEEKIIASRKNQALYLSYKIKGDLQALRQSGKLGVKYADDAFLEIVAVYIVTGYYPADKEKRIQDFFKKYPDELVEIINRQKDLPGQVDPTIRGKKNRGNFKKSSKISTNIANPINTMHEDTIVYKLRLARSQGLSATFNFFLNQLEESGKKNVKFKVEGVGKAQKRTKAKDKREVFVEDVAIDVTVEGTTQRIGIDVKKYEMGKDEQGKYYKYGRGPIQKSPEELTPEFISLEKFETYVYLTANSYFYNRALFDRLLGQPGGGGVGELYKVINWIRGIYGLIPAAPVDFSAYNNFNRVSEIVQQDNRMFVVLNDKTMLMTDFLDKVKDEALKGEDKVRNTVTKLSDNFIKALGPFQKGRFLTGEIKAEKKKFLRNAGAPQFWLQTQAQSISYYSQLQEKFINPKITDKLTEWRYGVKTEFKIY